VATTDTDEQATEAAPDEPKKGGAKKKIVMGVVALLLAAFVAKTFFLKPPPPTEEEVYLAGKTAALELWAECAEWNHLPFDPQAAADEYEAAHPPPTPAAGEAEGTGTEGTEGAEAPAESPNAAPPATGDGAHADVARGGGLGVRVRAAAGGGGGGAMPGNPVLEVDAITINLANDHYLKVGLGLELAEGSDPEAAKLHGTGAPARDLLIKTFSGRSMDELTPVDVRVQLQRQIGNQLCREHHGTIKRVLFTDFVMQ
jgi:flagellar basal body-associated protein FliL